jgi:hypothetical protein
MKLSNLITVLQGLEKQYGDLTVTGNVLDEEITSWTVLDSESRDVEYHGQEHGEAVEVFFQS